MQRLQMINKNARRILVTSDRAAHAVAPSLAGRQRAAEGRKRRDTGRGVRMVVYGVSGAAGLDEARSVIRHARR
jgi:hypothetical protein